MYTYNGYTYFGHILELMKKELNKIKKKRKSRDKNYTGRHVKEDNKTIRNILTCVSYLLLWQYITSKIIQQHIYWGFHYCTIINRLIRILLLWL